KACWEVVENLFDAHVNFLRYNAINNLLECFPDIVPFRERISDYLQLPSHLFTILQ
ncbi:hypothetical protein ACLOJK_008015, partial [Asimina triloba]